MNNKTGNGKYSKINKNTLKPKKNRIQSKINKLKYNSINKGKKL